MDTLDKVEQVVKNDLSWIQRHERVIIVFLVLLVGGYLGNRYLDNSAAEAKTKYDIAAAELVTVKEQAAQAKTDYQMTVDALTRQNASLAAAVSQRQVVLQQRQEAVKTLPLPEVGIRWQDLIGGSGDVVASTEGIAITDAGARRTVSMLEQVPVLVADKADIQTIADNRQKEIEKADVVIDSLNKQIVKADETCKLQVAEVKTAARKSKVKWFKFGFVTGFVSGIWLGHTIF